MRLRTDPGGGAPTAYDRPPFTPWPDRDPDMAEAAAALAARLGISRDRIDDWAVASHARARAATPRMAAEIVPLLGHTADGFTRDLTPRSPPAPPLTGPITAANTAVEADAAALCLIVSTALQPAPRASCA